MSMRLRKKMLVLVTTILTMQTLFLPASTIYAETMMSSRDYEQEGIESVKDTVDEEPAIDPLFSTPSQLQGTVNVPIEISITSNQDVSEVTVNLPEGSGIVKELLAEGESINQVGMTNKWILRSSTGKTAFSIPVVFQLSGTYEINIEGEKSLVDVQEENEDMEENQHREEEENNDLDSSPHNRATTWTMNTIRNFPLTMNYQGEILRPELIPDQYHIVEAPRSSLPSGIGWRTAAGQNISHSQTFSARSYVFPDIPSSTSGQPIDLFYNVSQSTSTTTQMYAGGLSASSIHSSFTANMVVRYKDGTLSDKPLFMAHSTGLNNTHHIPKGDLIGIGVFGSNAQINSSSIIITETATHYTLTYNQSDNGVIGLMMRNGAQHRVTTGTSGHGFVLFEGLSTRVTPTKTLTVSSSPAEGGVTSAYKNVLLEGESTEIKAVPNEGYKFVRWRTILGSSSIISDVNSANTTLVMGSSHTMVEAVYERETIQGQVEVRYVDSKGVEIAERDYLTGTVGESYQTEAKNISGYRVISTPNNDRGVYTENDIVVTYVYERTNRPPLDPLDPGTEVNPENKPELPENQGAVSIDFVSSFDFGQQSISINDKSYFSKPQRLLQEDANSQEEAERPNYIQITDQRSLSMRSGWTLAVTQRTQFQNTNGHELTGAQIRFRNGELITTPNNNTSLTPYTVRAGTLIPGNTRILGQAGALEGMGTWIYRFGDETNFRESLILDVPGTSQPQNTSYSTKLNWELLAIPPLDVGP